MRSRLARVGLILAAVLGIAATNIPSANATTVAAVVFVGNATVTPGLGYPCTPAPSNCPPTVTVNPGPPPSVTIGGTSGGFTFNSLVCVGVKVDIAKPKGTGPHGPLCSITASGSITGYCGLSQGSGSGVIGFAPVAPKTVTFNFHFTSVGGTLVITGTTTGAKAGGTIVSVVQAIPNITTGQSCAGGKTGQRDFIIVGAAVVADPTV